MFNKLREILGVAPQQKPQLKGDYLPMQQKALPMRQMAQPMQRTPAQRDFPGRTNYGVPQDEMIDTPIGYLTEDQYNQGVTGRLQRQVNPMGFNQGVTQDVYPSLGIRTRNPMGFDSIPNNYTGGRTGYYQGSNPNLNSLDDFEQKLRVY